MNTITILCPTTIDHKTGQPLLNSVMEKTIEKNDTITLDFTNTASMDSLGGAWLVKIAEHVHKHDAKLLCEKTNSPVADFITLIEPSLTGHKIKTKRREGFLESLGTDIFGVWYEFKDFINLAVDALYWMLIAPFEGKKFRWGLCVDELHEMGVNAVKITFVMNFLLGLTIAMLSAAQIADLGLGIYIADLVMIGFARELAALMTAIVVSARTGASITAELATMKVQEEIDALRGMGLNVHQFLIAPKLLALVIALPCLTMVGMIAGVLGGAVWGIGLLDFRVDQWFNETLAAAQWDDIMQGLLKAFFFANTIVLVGCHNGLRVRGGSRGVGLMTTRAVVMDIFLLVSIDMVFAAVFYYVLE